MSKQYQALSALDNHEDEKRIEKVHQKLTSCCKHFFVSLCRKNVTKTYDKKDLQILNDATNLGKNSFEYLSTDFRFTQPKLFFFVLKLLNISQQATINLFQLIIHLSTQSFYGYSMAKQFI